MATTTNKAHQVYLAWLQNTCTHATIRDIADLRDGKTLLELAEDLSGYPAGEPEAGKSKIHNINNCHRALRIFERAGVDTSSFQAEDFDSCNEKQILSFIWLLVRRFSQVDTREGTDFDTELLQWVQEKTAQRLHVPDLSPTTFRDGLALVALLEAFHPTQIDWDNVSEMSAAERVHFAFDLMNRLGFSSEHYSATDFLGTNTSKRDVATLLATLYNLLEMPSSGGQGPRKLTRSKGTLERHKLKQRKALPFGVQVHSPKDGMVQQLLERNNLHETDTFTMADVARCLADAINTSPISSPGPAQCAYDEEVRALVTTHDFQELLAGHLGVSRDSALTHKETTHLLEECMDETGGLRLPQLLSACISALQDTTLAAQAAAAQAEDKARHFEDETKKQEQLFQERLQETDLATQGLSEEAESDIANLQSEVAQYRSKCKALEGERSQMQGEMVALRQELAGSDELKRAAVDLRQENQRLRRENNTARKAAEAVDGRKERAVAALRSEGQTLRRKLREQAASLQGLEQERDVLAQEVARYQKLEQENVSLRRASRDLTQQLHGSPHSQPSHVKGVGEGEGETDEESLTLDEELRQASEPSSARLLPSAPSSSAGQKGITSANRRLATRNSELESTLSERSQDLYRATQQLQAEKELSSHYEAVNAQLKEQLEMTRADAQRMDEALDAERAGRLEAEKRQRQLEQQLQDQAERERQQRQEQQQQQPRAQLAAQAKREGTLPGTDREAFVAHILDGIARDSTMTDREKEGWRAAVMALQRLCDRLEGDLATARADARNARGRRLPAGTQKLAESEELQRELEALRKQNTELHSTHETVTESQLAALNLKERQLQQLRSTVAAQSEALEEQKKRLEEVTTAYEQARASLESYVGTAQVEVAVHREVLEHTFNGNMGNYQLERVMHEKESHVWFKTPDRPRVMPSSLYPFRPEEDEQLREAAQGLSTASTENWHHAAFAVPGRLDSELRERYGALRGHDERQHSAVLSRYTPSATSHDPPNAQQQQHQQQRHGTHRQPPPGYGGVDAYPSDTMSAYMEWPEAYETDYQDGVQSQRSALGHETESDESEGTTVFGDNFDPILQQHLGFI